MCVFYFHHQRTKSDIENCHFNSSVFFLVIWICCNMLDAVVILIIYCSLFKLLFIRCDPVWSVCTARTAKQRQHHLLCLFFVVSDLSLNPFVSIVTQFINKLHWNSLAHDECMLNNHLMIPPFFHQKTQLKTHVPHFFFWFWWQHPAQ